MRILGVLGLCLCSGAAFASTGTDICAPAEALFPQPGRTGAAGQNLFRPLPLLAPVRASPGAPGTLGLGIIANHATLGDTAGPAAVYVGNYSVTDMPMFKYLAPAGEHVMLVRPEGGATLLPAMCLSGASWGFGGTQWALRQGDTLDVHFSSRLDYTGIDSVPVPTNGAVPCRSSNLHTHGLLVSPYHPARAGAGPYGDYVLDVTQPPNSGDIGSQFDNCGTKLGGTAMLGHGLTASTLHYVTQIPGTPGVSSLASGQHPSGLFWYHPHPHGFSKFQVDGGTTGAITVGDISDYACPAGQGSPGACDLSTANQRVLALKDTQILAAGPGQWTAVHDAESGFCAPAGPPSRQGECDAIAKGVTGKWIFTINGVEFPLLRAGAGRLEIWRIVNSAANMTYQLSVVPERAGQANLPFQLLSTDGVSVRPAPGAGMRTQLLIMPATRVEIAIPAPAEGGAYLLHNASVQTGQSGSGDIWPAVDLARIIWAAPAAAAPAVTVPRGDGAAPMVVRGPATPVPHAVAASAGLPANCVFNPGDTRVVYFVHRFVHVFGGQLPQPGGRGGVEASTHEVFGLIAGVRHEDGTMDFLGDGSVPVLHRVEDVWNAGVGGPDVAFPAFMHNAYGTVCTVKGNVEPWELQNWTGEDHNFHVHQSRFTLNPAGRFQFPNPLLVPNEDATLRQTDSAVKDFIDPSYATAYHDTIPVPRGQSLCRAHPDAPGCDGHAARECTGAPDMKLCHRPGVISVLMDFSRNEQVGSFVYHCHILEHEDGGMMAQISVMCPVGDASCALAQAAEALCRTPHG